MFSIEKSWNIASFLIIIVAVILILRDNPFPAGIIFIMIGFIDSYFDQNIIKNILPIGAGLTFILFAYNVGYLAYTPIAGVVAIYGINYYKNRNQKSQN